VTVRVGHRGPALRRRPGTGAARQVTRSRRTGRPPSKSLRVSHGVAVPTRLPAPSAGNGGVQSDASSLMRPLAHTYPRHPLETLPNLPTSARTPGGMRTGTSESDAWTRKHLTRKHLTRKHLTRKHLTRNYLTRKHLTRNHLTRNHLTRKLPVRGQELAEGLTRSRPAGLLADRQATEACLRVRPANTLKHRDIRRPSVHSGPGCPHSSQRPGSHSSQWIDRYLSADRLIAGSPTIKSVPGLNAPCLQAPCLRRTAPGGGYFRRSLVRSRTQSLQTGPWVHTRSIRTDHGGLSLMRRVCTSMLGLDGRAPVPSPHPNPPPPASLHSGQAPGKEITGSGPHRLSLPPGRRAGAREPEGPRGAAP
jgi:hypothetical protein